MMPVNSNSTFEQNILYPWHFFNRVLSMLRRKAIIIKEIIALVFSVFGDE